MRLSIATKVFLGFALVLITSGLVSVYGIVRIQRIGDSLGLVSTGYFRLASEAGRLEGSQRERSRSIDNLLKERDPAARARLLEVDRTFARVVFDNVARARLLAQEVREGAGPKDREALVRVDAALVQLEQLFALEAQEVSGLAAALETPQGRRPGAPEDFPELGEPIARLRTTARRVDYGIKNGLQNALRDEMNRGVAEADRQQQGARWALLGLSLLALGVGVLVAGLAQRALAPIRGLTEAAQRLGRGSPESVAALPERGGDELAVLAHEFNAMAQRLSQRERELRAQGEALVRSERLAAIGRIAAQITHEIRNPLSSISLNAEELGERLRAQVGPGAAAMPGDGARGPVLLCEAIVREVDRLAAITEEYLRFARVPRPTLHRTDLNDLVTDLVDFVRPQSAAAGVRLELRLDARLGPVQADAAQVRQLLFNLVRNAQEAMASGGTLLLATEAEPAGACVRVQDTGPGIAPERLARIFDPFFTTKERGTGLGLALAQEIAQEHGGSLTCESTPGVGTTFLLRVPQGQPEPLAVPPARIPGGPLGNQASSPGGEPLEAPRETARPPPTAIASS